jgi:hypothetical protein
MPRPRKRFRERKVTRGDDKLNRGPIRPSDVRSTERDLRDDQIHFYNSGERTTKTWLGWRPFDDWFKISEHMKKSMDPDCSDMTQKIIFWHPKAM